MTQDDAQPSFLELPIGFKLEIFRTLFRRYGEIIVDEIERDVQRMASLDPLDELLVVAHLFEILDRLKEACHLPRHYERAKTIEDFELQTQFAIKHFPWLADDLDAESIMPHQAIPDNISQRLESLKRRVADRFAREVRGAVERFEISSPIEQIFLMEWKFAEVEHRFGVTIEPKALVETGNGTYELDFLIRRKGDDEFQFRVGIELDGHDFHEKTKQQVASDRRRERQIVSTGITILRFTGSEIVRNCQACIGEVADYLANRAG